MWTYQRTVKAILVIAGLIFAQGALAQDKMPSGTLDIDEVQVAFLVSGNLGGGTLHYNGQDYRFKIGGLGVGGIGASTIEATGEVFDLNDVADFAGPYAEARAGAVIGDKSLGKLWLRNSKGVILSLKAKREGVMLSLGGDAVDIKMDN